MEGLLFFFLFEGIDCGDLSLGLELGGGVVNLKRKK